MASEQQAGTRRTRSKTVAAEAQLSSTNLSDEDKAALKTLEAARYQEKKREWAAWANAQFTACKNSRSAHERQWYINLAFVNGKHYVAPMDMPGGGFRLSVPKQPAWRVKMVINKVRTAVRTECAKLSNSRPIPTVVPASGEVDDFAASQVAEQLLKNAFDTSEFRKTYRSWIWWGSVCGNSFLKSYWAPNESDPDMLEPEQPMLDGEGHPVIDPSTGEPMMQEQRPAKGRIVMERVSPFHIYVPDLLTEDLEKQPYLFHVTTRTPLWVKNTYGIDATPDSKSANTIMESAFLVSKGADEHLDSVMVKEMWLKPNAHQDFPDGGLLTIINNSVVQCVEKWPWPFREYPFYKYDGLYTGGFYCDSMVVDLIPLNKEYNRTRSQMIEIKNTMGKPKLIYQKGSINPRQISSEPGQGVAYIPGFQPPQILPPAEIPATMPAELERLNVDFDDISGQHEISRAGTPPQVTSGTAIAFLQEQDDTKLSYQVSSIEGAIELLGKHYLKYIATYWETPRIVRITGKDNAFEAHHWKASDLKGNTDVKIQTGSALPQSRAAKQAMVTEFMQNGWIEPSMGLEIMDLGALDRVISEILADKMQAQRENFKLSKLDLEELQNLEVLQNDLKDQGGDPGTPPLLIPVNSWDNHQAHITFHNQYRKSQEFELLDPLIKKQFELHVQMHQLAVTAPQQSELMNTTPINDPEAPVADPETGQLMPGPFNTPPVGPEEQPELPFEQEKAEMGIMAEQEAMQHQAQLHQLELIKEQMKIKAQEQKMEQEGKLASAKERAALARSRQQAKKEEK